ncbi:MAG: hypothetical protein ACRYF3_08215 [Janthinobacterium lividum]
MNPAEHRHAEVIRLYKDVYGRNVAGDQDIARCCEHELSKIEPMPPAANNSPKTVAPQQQSGRIRSEPEESEAEFAGLALLIILIFFVVVDVALAIYVVSHAREWFLT